MLFAAGLHFHEAILVGSIWFWIFLGAIFAAVTVLTEWEKGLFAFLTFLLGGALLQVFGDADFLGYIWHHPILVFVYVGLYFAGGVGWSLVKWRWYCSGQREKYDDLKETWLESKKIKGTRVPPELVPEWEAYLSDKRNYSYGNDTCHVKGMEMTLEEIKDNRGPRFRNHKGRCLNWMTFWPCSAFWTLLNDPLRKLFRQAMTALKGVYEAIAANAWKGVASDFEKPESALAEELPPLGPDGNRLN